MISTSFRCSRPDNWVAPRPHTDPSQRYLKYGPIQPMEDERGLFRRLFARR